MSQSEPRSHLTVRSVLEIIANVAIVVVAAVVVWRLFSAPKSTPSPTKGREGVPSQPVALGDVPLEGHPAAPVALIVYSDFQCPYCAQFARQTLPIIRAKYVATGKLRVAFKHLPLVALHPHARHAAEVSVCANERGSFWPFHDTLFHHQRTLDPAFIEKLAADAGMDDGFLRECVTRARPVVQRDMDEAKTLQIRGTPTMLVGRVQSDGSARVTERLSGAVSAEKLSDAIDVVLAKGLSSRH